MLETLRQYARERLKESGEAEELYRRFAQYYLLWAEATASPLGDRAGREWLDRAEAEQDNLRAALSWFRERDAATEGLRLAAALCHLWGERTSYAEGRAWLEQFLARAPTALDPELHARVLSTLGELAYRQGDRRAAERLLEEALVILRTQGDLREVACLTRKLALMALNQAGDLARAQALLEESLPLHRALGDNWATAAALSALGGVAHAAGDYERACSCWEEAHALTASEGASGWLAASWFTRGRLAYEQGDYRQAQTLLQHGLAVQIGMAPKAREALSSVRFPSPSANPDGSTVRALVETRLAIASACNPGRYQPGASSHAARIALELGDPRAARVLCEKRIACHRELGSRVDLVWALIDMGSAARLCGDSVAARRHLEEALAIARRLEFPRGITDALQGLGLVTSDGGEFDAAQRYLEESLALLRDLGHPWPLALTLEGLGALAVRTGDLTVARTRIEEALAIQRRLKRPIGLASALRRAALAAVEENPDRARVRLREGLAHLRLLLDPIGIGECCEILADLPATEAKPTDAACLLGAADGLRDRAGAPVPPADRPRQERTVARLRSALGDATYRAAWNESRLWTSSQVLEQAGAALAEA
jgi:tetratricopeptide (TPR) repeat protein